METELYRTVDCNDRLPEIEGRYLVLNHGQWHEANYSYNYSFHEEMTDCSGVTHWMEAMELPTEKETREKVESIFNTDHTNTWMAGFNFVLNHIKGEQS